MKDSGEKERWEEIAKAVALNAWQDFKERMICGETFARDLQPHILSAIAESHQSETGQPEPAFGVHIKEAVEAIKPLFRKKEPLQHSTVETQDALLRAATNLLASAKGGQRRSIDAIVVSLSALGALSEQTRRAADSVRRGNEAGAALLSKEAELAPTVEPLPQEWHVCHCDKCGAKMFNANDADLRRQVASLQRKLEEAELWSKTAWNAHQKIDSQREVIAGMRALLQELHDEEPKLCGTPGCVICQRRERIQELLALSSPVPTLLNHTRVWKSALGWIPKQQKL